MWGERYERQEDWDSWWRMLNQLTGGSRESGKHWKPCLGAWHFCWPCLMNALSVGETDAGGEGTLECIYITSLSVFWPPDLWRIKRLCFTTSRKCGSWVRLGDCSVGKALAVQVWVPEFRSPEYMQILGGSSEGAASNSSAQKARRDS